MGTGDNTNESIVWFPGESTGHKPSGESVAVPQGSVVAAHWFDIAGWDKSNGQSWRTDDYEPVQIEDTKGFADPESLPFFSMIVPEELGGWYYAELSVVYSTLSSTGFVCGNIGGSSDGTVWAPCLGLARQVLTITATRHLDGGGNEFDIANFINISGQSVHIIRADFFAVLLEST